jgi:acetoin utilization deacetylase AcuC-like enzyme
MKVLFSGRCLEFRSPGHPESPERVGTVYERIKDRFSFIGPSPCTEKDILLVHSRNLLDQVKSGNFFDADTPRIAGIFEYAKLSAGAAIQAAALAIGGENAFSLMRPPGHHATRDSLGGFCYFNNIAIAAARALERARKVAILDIDCHHGNGTQDIFMGNRKVLYVSLHQSPLYPGTGLGPEKNCLNFPLPPGTGEKKYLEALGHGMESIRRFDPGLIGVSAGFDTYAGDPITDLGLRKGTYRRIGEMISKAGKPVFSVLEGGYHPDMSACVEEFLAGLGG